MKASDCIRTRKSCRKFLEREVPREIVEEVIDEARRAPSYRNSQPWKVIALTRHKKNQLSEMLLGLQMAQAPVRPDIPEPGPWPEKIQELMKETALLRAAAFGTASDPDALRKAREANFRFYGAPLVLYFYQYASLGGWSLLDMGMFVQNVMLGFHARGISSVPQAYLIDYSPEIREFLELEGDKKLILGMSVGYPDMKDIRSSFSSPRISLENIFTWKD